MSKAQTQANIVFNLPDFALKLLHPKAAVILRENRLHIALQMLLAGMPELPLEDDTPPAAIREALAANPVDLGPKTSGPVQCVDHQVTVAKGAKVLVREYIPKGAEDSGCAVVYFHGGGWVLMSVDSHDKPVAHMAESLGVRAYSVDYRLAPEHPFPTPLDDCAKAWDWVQKHTGLKPGQLVVAGDSAGGNLATALCLRLKEAGQPQPALQWLIYPAVDAGMGSESIKVFADGFYLSAKAMSWFWGHYGSKQDENAANPQFSPLAAKDLAGLAPACVFTAGFDPLRDEGADYAEKLQKAGVETFHRDYPDMIHGFFSMGLIRGCRRRTADMLGEIRPRLPGK